MDLAELIERLDDDPHIERGIALPRVFGPLLGPGQGPPPRIGVGEITSSARRDTGALEVISRLRERQQRGSRAMPAGLAWYTPTGLVRYAVVRPDQRGILWQGTLGRFPALATMNTHQREQFIRRLITRRSGQRFRALPAGHRGADLVPRFDA